MYGRNEYYLLDRTIEEYRLRLGWNLNGREFYRSSRRVVNVV